MIIVQPGSRRFEGYCPGLLYVFLSRATDIGSEQDRSTSAIFFHTENMNNDRITDLLLGADGKEYKKVQKRRKWVRFLQKHKYEITITKKEKKSLIKWATNTRISKETLQNIVDDGSWRQSNELNY